MSTPLAKQRKKLGLTQEDIAQVLKTVQSEVSKVEAGEPPPKEEVLRWAKKYRVSARKFLALCEAARWDLPLWKYAVHSPQEIEGIDCTRKEIRTA
jgi:transcriptional regulator with XRE-family HTH domain